MAGGKPQRAVEDSSHSEFFQGRGSTGQDVGDCGARTGDWTVGQKAGSVSRGKVGLTWRKYCSRIVLRAGR